MSEQSKSLSDAERVEMRRATLADDLGAFDMRALLSRSYDALEATETQLRTLHEAHARLTELSTALVMTLDGYGGVTYGKQLDALRAALANPAPTPLEK